MYFEADSMPDFTAEAAFLPTCETCGRSGCSGLWGAAHCPSNREEPAPYSAPGADRETLRAMLLTAAREMAAADEVGDWETVDALEQEINTYTAALRESR